jgi:hypothetical protein
MKDGAVCNDAFLVCHEIYQAARELVNSRVPTTQLQSASKFLWRPDLRPRLVEYVADFARAGERALEYAPSSETFSGRKSGLMTKPFSGSRSARASRASRSTPRASRLILFRLYYLGGAEYQAARHLLGLSERTWSDWAEEIRARVGAELIRAGMYPPARYFRQASLAAARGTAAKKTSAAPAASTNHATEAKIKAVPCEPDFA